ncbi:MAG TPA: hypothetical protein ENL03_04305 [Phycisphaerae bacterium]|nr:hypothetical protein [Phycisphaerae bacterium]
MITPLIALLVFYLYLLVKGDLVKRPFFYCIGALGIIVALASAFFMVGSTGLNEKREIAAVQILANIFELIGILVAFVGAFAACFTGKLPVNVPGMESKDEAGE